LIEHDLRGKPDFGFPDLALALRCGGDVPSDRIHKTGALRRN
jgi:hypothetical protein